ncbi:DivIVA domain-containing protein [Kribbella rubisoli]|uniref:DivIVA domain-containing protein n=1 Tax=Kribbella rubisoli TaxID=3075929 RepID=A0A4Q7W2Z3_9ACTN|nr:DivIVA domain-containing protein [Kribbella rubisoli]RZU03602.1 DivIVA domain-containing protein [Kribbella rubisoli]
MTEPADFTRVRWREGYAIPEVDEFLDIASGWLTNR